MGASKTAQKQATRQRLYGALMELWANQPLAEVSVVELADRAGVSRMAFYRNCGTKEQVVEFYLDDLFGQYLQEMRAMTDLSVRSFTYRFFLNFEEHASLIAYLRRDGRGPAAAQVRPISSPDRGPTTPSPECLDARRGLPS